MNATAVHLHKSRCFLRAEWILVNCPRHKRAKLSGNSSRYQSIQYVFFYSIPKQANAYTHNFVSLEATDFIKEHWLEHRLFTLCKLSCIMHAREYRYQARTTHHQQKTNAFNRFYARIITRSWELLRRVGTKVFVGQRLSTIVTKHRNGESDDVHSQFES